ncbi:related to helicases [Cephalotrichum gorgonifer]|uniref:RNA helicase n=1 Tax=Cephalotrichum gorgonifer TaxID=2041049 RepID=A0AAE8MRQ5_9PEZI|nr:related to helicases [Cephalotrichum gorgonifer]
MVKKGKGKATPPASAAKDAASGPSSSKTPASSSKTPASKTPASKTPASKGKKSAPDAQPLPDAAPLAPPKPTAKQIIGGQSWTGKLPVNLFNELCQKQKWTQAYDMKKTPEGFMCWVSISAKDPKTQEVTKLEPFKIPADHKHLLCKETPLEARHYAATYALFRVCSMQNRHSVLPPDFKSLWKEFAALKSLDVKEGKEWMYSADPFKTHREREEAKAAAEKKRQEARAAAEKARNTPGVSGLVLRGNALEVSGRGNPMKGWNNAPKIEMGKKARIQLESLLRRSSTWNPYGVEIPADQRKRIVDELSKIGFRPSHVEEATSYCKDKDETLEWLLIHVPEDDLPPWALPGSYTAGVSVGASDLKREGAIKRLSLPGYSNELCRQVFDETGADEGKAAEVLQKILLGKADGLADGAAAPDDEEEDQGFYGTAEELWEEETATLESVFGENFTRESASLVQVRLDDLSDTHSKKNVNAVVQIRKSPNYPSQLLIGIVADLPSYVKLAIVRKTLKYVEESLKGEPMKMYFVVDWIQHNALGIIQNPGKLLDISSVASAASESQPAKAKSTRASKRRPPKPRAINWTPDMASKAEWLRRQQEPAWKKMIAGRQNLPAWNVEDAIVRTVEENHVTIISGETGSGKSTQSVQFILDNLYSKGLGSCANMIVTQPRRISALGLADRVAEERCTKVGDEIGYTIRGESRRGPQTRITFVTTGVLLRRLQVSGGRIEDVIASIADVSHIVVDEVHERSLDTDFLLTIIREVMSARKGALKLILMSATLDAATFKDYFAAEGLSVGLVEIAGRTFPVHDYYLDDIVRLTGFRPDGYDEWNDSGNQKDDAMGKTIQKLGYRINYQLIAETASAVDSELSATKSPGGILIFLPGVAEISQACRMLSSITSLHILPLHASLETREQKRVFAKPPPGKRKVVVATNVAETSITIDDIVAVIDSGKVKETTYDPQNNMRKLEENWASRAACKQRRGRAGRVQEGICYKLYTRNLEFQMAERPEPEIRRVPLEQLCLSVRAMGIRDVAKFMSRSPTPPEARAVEGAIKMLRRMGALDGEELTALGSQLAVIPADLRCGKLMVYGSIFGCLDDCVTIAAILSTRSPFMSPADKRELAREARMRFSRGEGDLLTDLNAFRQWEEMRAQLQNRQLRAWCDENFLSSQTLSDIASTRTQYYGSLREAGIPTAAPSTPKSNPSLLRAVTAASFTPQIARIQYPDKKFAASVSGAVELDPEARMIKYFAQDHGRVFVHPGSTLFGSQGFPELGGRVGFISYFNMVATSKVFMRDLTPFNNYTLLLFAGSITPDTLGRGLLIDDWLRLRGWARIGVLVSRLRKLLDDVIARAVDPTDGDDGVTTREVLDVVARLVEFDGLDA